MVLEEVGAWAECVDDEIVRGGAVRVAVVVHPHAAQACRDIDAHRTLTGSVGVGGNEQAGEIFPPILVGIVYRGISVEQGLPKCIVEVDPNLRGHGIAIEIQDFPWVQHHGLKGGVGKVELRGRKGCVGVVV